MHVDHEAGPGQRIVGYAAALGAALIALWLGGMLPAVHSGGVVTLSWEWAPQLGIALSFMVDGLSLLFALLISGIGALILLYSVGYMGGHPRFGRFVLYLVAFMFSMLGLVLASDLITLFVFWELTSVTSYLLIGFDHDKPQARRNALQAMLVTGAGGLAMLAGLILMGIEAGSMDLVQILTGPGLQDSGMYGAILILVLLGAFTKSAQFPFHFWLPNAMAAPTPVSAYLHSATMVKAGVYLLARLHPVLGGTTAWALTLGVAGLVTALLASVLALRQSDLKLALAYTTLMALGVITLFLAGSTPYALTAAIGFLVVHSLYKATLFMVVGAIDHATGTRELDRLGGLSRAMPLTMAAAVLAAVSMAGLPPLIGWIGKELLYAGALSMAGAPLVTLGVVLANALMVAVAGVIVLGPFFGAPRASGEGVEDAPWQMVAGPLLLAGLGLVFGLFAQALLGPLIGATLTGSLAQERAAGLHLWAGFNLPLLLSLATFALGAVLYLNQHRIRALIAGCEARLPHFDPGWDRLLDGLRVLAEWQTRLIQNGRLSHYLLVVFVVLAAAMGSAALFGRPVLIVDFSAPLLIWLIAAFAMAGAILATGTASRIAAITGLSTVGIAVALIFIFYGAPDVATTQLMVETLAAVLFGIAALRLPGIREYRPTGQRWLHVSVASVVGLSVTLVLLAVTSHPLDRRITTYFEENSYIIAHGRNIVNVVLVDFRAFDTFGELSVVLLASIGAYALIKRRGGNGGAS